MIFDAGNLVLNGANTGHDLAITITHATCEFEDTTCHCLVQLLNQQM